MDPNYLEFEQPIAELEAKISELRLVGSDNELNIGEEIQNLKGKSIKLTEKIYSNLSSWQISQVARHPLRPYTLDYSNTSSPTSMSYTETVCSPTIRP